MKRTSGYALALGLVFVLSSCGKEDRPVYSTQPIPPGAIPYIGNQIPTPGVRTVSEPAKGQPAGVGVRFPGHPEAIKPRTSPLPPVELLVKERPSLEQLTEYFSKLADQSNAKWLYFGAAAVEKAESFDKRAIDFETFKKTYDFFRTATDQSERKWLFFGTSAVDLSLTLCDTPNFDLDVFKSRYEFYRNLTDQNRSSWLYFGREAVQKTFDQLKINIDLKTVAPETR